jgi:NDP-sugar pyrophosphorylase family protein
MPTLFSLIQEQSMRVIAYPIHEPWLDIGNPSDLAEAQKKATGI